MWLHGTGLQSVAGALQCMQITIISSVWRRGKTYVYNYRDQPDSTQLVTWEGGNSLVVQVELPVVVVVVMVAYFSACIFHQTIYSVAGREPHRAKHCPTLNSKFGLEVLYTGDIMIGLEIWEDIKHH